MQYIVADIRIELPQAFISGHFGRALEPFHQGEAAPAKATDCAAAQSSTPALVLTPSVHIDAGAAYRELDAFDFADAQADCRLGRDELGWLLEMAPRNGSAPARFRMERDTNHVHTDITPAHDPALMRFGVWTAYNIAAVQRQAAAIHSSAIRIGDTAILFLGESGTGKSTHTRLWREHIPGARLLNDDSPIVHADHTSARVYGSPWSGKTPCYINESCPIRAIVRLSQAPHNRIRRLRPIEAIGALLPSCPPMFAHDKELHEALCTLVSDILRHTPVYHLECLPDADAARLAYKTIFGDEATQSR